jgi:enoyl-CoA hydratase/carnithine racemase
LGVITLDDGKVNVINWDFINEMNEAFGRAIADQAGALILTTGRPGILSAGLDMKLFATPSVLDLCRFFPISTIAAYAGHAIAGGFVISCACDRYLMLDGPFRIQMNEVANKMVTPSWLALICKSSIPPRWQREALLHTRAYSPREVFDRGIVDTLIEPGGDVMEAAKAVAQDLLKLDVRWSYA